MLKNCVGLESYFMKYGELLGAKAVEAVLPLYRAGVDQSVDLSFVSEWDPNRVPYAAQANTVNALVKAWTSREWINRKRVRKASKVISGEMGTGKTLLGAAGIHAHAVATRGGRYRVWSEWKTTFMAEDRDGQPMACPTTMRTLDPIPVGYRVIIMCPSHLIEKWEREIHMTVPNSVVYTFDKTDPNKADDSFKMVANYIDSCRAPRGEVATEGVGRPEPCDVSTDIGPHINGMGDLVDRPYKVEAVTSRRAHKPRMGRARWKKPDRPEWAIVGQNQAKADPEWQGLGERRFVHPAGVIRSKLVGYEDVVDEQGRPVRRNGETLTRPVLKKVPCCPKCGAIAPASLDEMWEKQAVCKTLILREVGTEDRSKADGGLITLCPIPDDCLDTKKGETVKYKDRTYKAEECGERLWQWTPKPRKWAPAKLFHKQGRKMFDYFILDEMHEEKEAGSGQAIAAGKIMKSARRILGLTGTLIAGKASHLFPLLFRMAPHSLVEDGFSWGGEMAFSKLYGKIEKTVVTKFGGKKTTRTNNARGRGQTSMRKEDEGNSKETSDVKPGVMPTFFGKHLIDKAIFISLSEMEDDLPALVDDDRSLIAVDMDETLADEYDRIQTELIQKNTELLMKGSTKLLGAMLRTLLEYPDKPFGWTGPYPNRDAVGYFSEPVRNENTWKDVVQPADLDQNVVQAKEQALYDLCMREAAEGRQVWVYCLQTGKRDVMTRLSGILKRGGLKVKVLRKETAAPREREAWIAKNGPHANVIISNPVLVSTGLDFFDKAGTFNFCTIAFYEGDYRVNLIRQAGRRHWRIGQPRECRTYYFYYRGTMQERQVIHVGEKYAASKSLEGKFSPEGLAALAGDGLAMTEMAKALEQKIADPRAAWAKLRTEQKAKLVVLHKTGALGRLAGAVRDDPALHDAAELILTDDDFSLLDDFNPDDFIISDDEFALLDETLEDLGIPLDSLVA